MSFVPAGAEDYCSDDSDDFHFGDETDDNEQSYTLPDYGSAGHSSHKSDDLLSRNQRWAGINGHRMKRRSGASRRDGRGSPLISEDFKTAACRGNLEEVRNLINRGMKVDTVLSGGWTALMYSVYSGHPDVAAYLLEKGADVDFTSTEALYCPLLACCTSKAKEDVQVECLDLLLQNDVCVDVHEGNHMTPLMFTAQNGHVKMVSKLLLAKSDPNKQDNRGWTALCYAALSGKVKSVRLLLDNGADPMKNCSEGTAADIAYGQGNTEVSDILDQFRNPEAAVTTNGATEKEKSVRSEAPAATGGYRVYNDLDLFLCGLDLPDLIPLFHSHKVDFAELLRLTEEDLEKMGIQQFGSRRKIMRSVHEIHKLKWERSSIRNPSSNVLSQQESMAILDNITQHLSYITSCLDYMHSNWSTHHTLEDTHQSGASIGQLSELVSRLLLKTPKITRSVKRLEEDLKEATKRRNAAAGDLIVDPDTGGRLMSPRRWFVFMLGGAILASAAYYFWPSVTKASTD